MKLNQMLKYSFILILFLSVNTGWSKDQDEKRRVVEKSYSVNTSTLLSIKNKFGKIEINSWDKNEFSIKIEIISRGRSEERAQRILDEIEIEIDESSTEISLETS